MANVFSNFGFDFYNLNINRLQIGYQNFNYLDNAFVAVNGIVYADIYEVVYNYNGYVFSSIFAGPNLIRDPSTGAVTGTVTGYVESVWNGSTWQTSWGVENANISAAALWNASLTASNSDDLAILRQGLSGADNFNLSSQNDGVNGFEGNDTIYARGGDDNIWGGEGADFIDGGDGYDYARYDYATSGVYARLDTGLGYSGEAAGDTFKLIEGLVGSAYSDTLVGDAGGNALYGQGGDDSLYGMGGDDHLSGDGGNDLLSGDAGNDSLDGGAGDDTAVFTQALANYSVRNVGTNITVSGPDGSDVLSNIEHLRFADMAINLNAGDSIVTAPGGNSNFDGGAGNDIISFNFKLTDATISSSGKHLIVDGPSGSHTVLTGVEAFVFTDGTVNNNDGDPLVDDLFYYSHNRDVWNAHVDADQHYHQSGWHEGRDPNAFFSTSFYLSLNQDVKKAGIDPLAHFDQFGWREGRQPSAAFNDAAYLAANPDVAAARVDPLAHFLQSGQGEGRQATALTSLIGPHGFDSVFYLQHNPDVQAAQIDPFQHYQNFGWKEGRNPNALFDAKGYLTANPDVANAHINPLDHYDQFGWREGRDPSTAFDTTEYLSHYSDVAAAHIDPLLHYLQHGIHEGRQTFADGLWV